MRKLILLIFCIMTLIGLSSFVSANIPTDYKSPNMVYLYRFDESAGTTTTEPNITLDGDFDFVSSDGAQTVTGGQFGNAIKGDGSSKMITSPQDALIGRLGGCVSGAEGSLSFWLKDSTNTDSREDFLWFQEGNSNWNSFGLVVYTSNLVTFYVKTSTSPSTTGTYAEATIPDTAVQDGNWHSFGATWNNSKICYYMNGTFLECDDVASGGNGGFCQGGDQNDGGFFAEVHGGAWDRYKTDAYIDELAFFNQSLTQTDFQNIYDDSFGANPPNITIESCMSSGDTTEPYTTPDTTPTFNVTTDINAYCRIGDTNQSYSPMGQSRNCTTTGAKSHICTLTVQDELVYSTDYVYISCDSSYDGSAYNSTEELTMDITQLETNTSKAIEEGINSSDIHPATIYRTQQVYIRDLNNNQTWATVDRLAVKDSKRWLLNYVINSGGLLGLFNITPAVYVWDKTDLAMNAIRSEVSGLINSTYP